MDSQYASIGRQTLEKIRQKKAAGAAPKSFDTRLGKIDNTSLLFQVKEMEKRNKDLDEENKDLSSKLQSKETENEMLRTKVNNMSMRLRSFINRLKEAEDDELRAEQESAALRAELLRMQEKALSDHHVAVMVKEKKFRDMGADIERLEICRQKLLAEVDLQSSEIERLSEDNSVLRSDYEKVLAKLEGRDDVETASASPPEVAVVSVEETSTVEDRANLVEINLWSKLWSMY